MKSEVKCVWQDGDNLPSGFLKMNNIPRKGELVNINEHFAVSGRVKDVIRTYVNGSEYVTIILGEKF